MTNNGLNLEILKYLIIFLNECFDIAIGFNDSFSVIRFLSESDSG